MKIFFDGDQLHISSSVIGIRKEVFRNCSRSICIVRVISSSRCSLNLSFKRLLISPMPIVSYSGCDSIRNHLCFSMWRDKTRSRIPQESQDYGLLQKRGRVWKFKCEQTFKFFIDDNYFIVVRRQTFIERKPERKRRLSQENFAQRNAYFIYTAFYQISWTKRYSRKRDSKICLNLLVCPAESIIRDLLLGKAVIFEFW